ncbi:MAG: branched-chain amino acid ABC transporter permease [Candidatus Rokubacteria bacterium 13_1_40CM_69_27]|nr:MAG: branched-chain amino acid ABC transporter permease [Candidatus Rokubacteria bacterium 13_1_40CM_69_27]
MEWYEVLVQQTINGLTRGSVFALIAMGYTMVYGVIELINFAHGDVFMLGLFIPLTVVTLLGVSTTLVGWQILGVLLPLFLVTMLVTGAINLTIDRVAYRPLRRAPRLAPLITAIGVSFMIENLAMLWKGPAPIPFPDLFPNVDILNAWLGIDTLIYFTTKDLFVVVVTLPLMLALELFVTRTRWGKAMRATAQDRETAAAMGINVERMIMLTFFTGGALAGAAGLIQGMYYNIGQWWMGYQAGLRAFTAAVIGGIGNMPGAALGGLFIGFLSAWSDQYISARWTNALVFAILILFLVFRPQGLLGERPPDRT